MSHALLCTLPQPHGVALRLCCIAVNLITHQSYLHRALNKASEATVLSYLGFRAGSVLAIIMRAKKLPDRKPLIKGGGPRDMVGGAYPASSKRSNAYSKSRFTSGHHYRLSLSALRRSYSPAIKPVVASKSCPCLHCRIPRSFSCRCYSS